MNNKLTGLVRPEPVKSRKLVLQVFRTSTNDEAPISASSTLRQNRGPIASALT